MREGIEQLPVAYSVEVLVDAPAVDVRRRVGAWASVEPAGDGRSRVRMSADDLAWPAMALVSLDAGFSVLGPPEMVDYLRDVADRFTRATPS